MLLTNNLRRFFAGLKSVVIKRTPRKVRCLRCKELFDTVADVRWHIELTHPWRETERLEIVQFYRLNPHYTMVAMQEQFGRRAYMIARIIDQEFEHTGETRFGRLFRGPRHPTEKVKEWFLSTVCKECGEDRPGDARVEGGMKCGNCAYGGVTSFDQVER